MQHGAWVVPRGGCWMGCGRHVCRARVRRGGGRRVVKDPVHGLSEPSLRREGACACRVGEATGRRLAMLGGRGGIHAMAQPYNALFYVVMP